MIRLILFRRRPMHATTAPTTQWFEIFLDMTSLQARAPAPLRQGRLSLTRRVPFLYARVHPLTQKVPFLCCPFVSPLFARQSSCTTVSRA